MVLLLVRIILQRILQDFYTKYGDGAADIAPIFGLNKRQGRQLLKYLNAPKHLYEKVPTADLEDDKPQLPDEEAFGCYL